MSDPARLAARILIERALVQSETTLEEAGADGKVILAVVPGPCWSRVVRDEWGSFVRSDEYCIAGGDRYWSDRQGWLAWVEDDAASPSPYLDAEAFSAAISSGRHCAGFAASTAQLPVDLVQAADHVLVLPALTQADVKSLAQSLCGGAVHDLVDAGIAASLTPRLLRLAYRRHYDATAFIKKLTEVCSREPRTGAAGPIKFSREPSLAQLHGMDSAVAWGYRLAKDVAAFKEGELSWTDIDRGCLLSGAPGTGKTTYAKALAATCGLHLVQGSYATWIATESGHQGDFVRGMKATFQEARANAPAIVFLDEIDSFPSRSMVSRSHPEWHVQAVNALLAEVDDALARPGVVIIGACNEPSRLDPALVRHGRLGTRFSIELPGPKALALIMREHLRPDELADTSTLLEDLALLATGLTGADIEAAVRAARRRARVGERRISIEDLEAELEGSDVLPLGHLETAALHAAGRAFAVEVLFPGQLEGVSLRQGDVYVSWIAPTHARRLRELQRELVCLLAGRAAEEAFVGEPSTLAGGSAASSLAAATKLAMTAVASWGLALPISSRASAWGLTGSPDAVWYGAPDDWRTPDALVATPGLLGKALALLGDAYAEALALVGKSRQPIAALTQALNERRALNGATVAGIVSGYHR